MLDRVAFGVPREQDLPVASVCSRNLHSVPRIFYEVATPYKLSVSACTSAAEATMDPMQLCYRLYRVARQRPKAKLFAAVTCNNPCLAFRTASSFF